MSPEAGVDPALVERARRRFAERFGETPRPGWRSPPVA